MNGGAPYQEQANPGTFTLWSGYRDIVPASHQENMFQWVWPAHSLGSHSQVVLQTLGAKQFFRSSCLHTFSKTLYTCAVGRKCGRKRPVSSPRSEMTLVAHHGNPNLPILDHWSRALPSRCSHMKASIERSYTADHDVTL